MEKINIIYIVGEFEVFEEDGALDRIEKREYMELTSTLEGSLNDDECNFLNTNMNDGRIKDLKNEGINNIYYSALDIPTMIEKFIKELGFESDEVYNEENGSYTEIYFNGVELYIGSIDRNSFNKLNNKYK